MPARICLLGREFGNLKVIHEYPPGEKLCLCRCDCGTETKVIRGQLLSGKTKSCGCLLLNGPVRHGHARSGHHSKTYRTWSQMIYRCSNPEDDSFKHYGGRGIKVCPRWADFENFLADMGERPDGVTIERVDNNGNYEPSNCRWASAKDQCRNRRSNRIFTINGTTACLAEFCENHGQPYAVVNMRINKLGWSIERALTTPVKPSSRQPHLH